MATFRLDQEPWIPVVGTDGLSRQFNLIQVFDNASSISRLGGSPLEVAAITRFLLAITHLTETPTTLDAWNNHWQDRAAFMRRCSEYVRRHPGAWDLFDALHPFGQMPDLKKTINPAHLLVYEAARKNKPLFVDHSAATTPDPILAPALARGLFTTNAYGGSSAAGREASYYMGPLAMRSVAILCGGTLDATLLLNLIVQREPPRDYDWNVHGRRPPNRMMDSVDIVQRYLWTSRHARLIPDGQGAPQATWIMLAPGDELPEDERALDPMVVMRKDSKGTAYVPFRLEAGLALWRSAHVLLNWQEGTKCVAAVDQLRKLLRRELFPRDHPVSMRVCAVAGDAKGPTTELWRDESLPFGVSVVADESRFAELVRAVGDAEDQAKITRSRIYSFAARYLQGASESQSDKKDVASLADELCPDLADFWATLAPTGERIACDGFDEAAWSSELKAALASAFRRAVDRLPPDARRFRAEFGCQNIRSKKAKKGASR